MSRLKLPPGATVLNTNYNAGSDSSGDGLPGSPFKTANYALAYAADVYDLNSVNQSQLFIRLADNVVDLQGIHAPQHAFVGAQGLDAITIQGGTNSEIHGVGIPAIGAYFGVYRVQNITLSSDVNNGIDAKYGARLKLDNVNFGACGGACINEDEFSSVMQAGPVSISGNSQYYLTSCTSRYESFGNAININCNLSMQSFIYGSGGGELTFSNSAINLNGHTVTGKRFSLYPFTTLDSGGAGVNFFPGNQAGTNNGGSYG